MTTWSIAGQYLEACRCRFVCPRVTSNATAPATDGFCRFAMTYRIDAGRQGALLVAWGAWTLVAALA